MAHFADGTPYSYRREDDGGAVNVGWLSRDHRYPVGLVSNEAVDALLRLARDHAVNRTRGWHRCELCPGAEEEGRREPSSELLDGLPVLLGDAEIRVVGRSGTTYAAPTLVAHYVRSHGYRPPEDFLLGLDRTHAE
jgi:hypothetical protein